MTGATIRRALKQLLVRSRLDVLIRRFHGGDGTILNFHRVRPRDPGWMFEMNHRNSVAPAQFCGLLDALAGADIDIVDLDEALSRLSAKRGRRFVVITFDDGYRDNYEIVLPIVQARGVAITVYVTPGLIDATSPLWWYAVDQVISRESRLRLHLDSEVEFAIASHAAKETAFAVVTAFFLRATPLDGARVAKTLTERYGVDFEALAKAHIMSWEMVRRLAASPLVTIGAHTLRHSNLSVLDESAARLEMADSRARLVAETGQDVRHFAYPYGTRAAVGPREVKLASDLGFRTAVTTNAGNLFFQHASHAHVWPRQGMGPDDGPDALRLKLAGVARFFRTPLKPIEIAPETGA